MQGTRPGTHLHTPSFIKSSKRPGVATTMDAPLRSACTCSRLGTPPYTHTVLQHKNNGGRWRGAFSRAG